MENIIEKLPAEFVANMKNRLGEQFDSYLLAMQKEPVQGIRLNTLKANKEILGEFAVVNNIPYSDNGYVMNSSKIGKHPYHIAGLVYVQEPSSMAAVCSSGLKDEPDKNLAVLDLCAAPGGKSGQIAEILAGKGVLVSNEIENKRAKILQGNIERMGYRNVIITNSSPQTLAKNLPHMFDYVFVDAPCGGEGMFRKDPDTILEWKQERLISNGQRQKEILAEAHKMLKPNGKLIYSTCTFAEEENEQVVDWFVNNFGYSLVLPNKEILSVSVCQSIKEARRFYPHTSIGEGQFVCVMQKDHGSEEFIRSQRLPKMGNSEYKLLNEFIQSNFVLDQEIQPAKVGNNICLLTAETKNMLEFLQRVPVLNAGVTAGTIEKGRFIPHNNMFSSFGNCAIQKINFSIDDEQLKKYLHGEQLENNQNFASGYVAVCVNGHAFAGARVSGNSLKNLFPKGLRI